MPDFYAIHDLAMQHEAELAREQAEEQERKALEYERKQKKRQADRYAGAAGLLLYLLENLEQE